MKPTSPLSLVLFLSLTTALPIPTKDCLHTTNCQAWLREIFSDSSPPDIKNDHTLPTRLPGNPHFPAHQLNPPSSSPASHREIEEQFNNAPLQPPKTQRPSQALAVNRPLPSSYLLSLSSSAQQNPPQGEPDSTSAADALPSKPTSALPKLREEDTVRYWATIGSDSVGGKERLEGLRGSGGLVVSDGHVVKCGDYSRVPGSAYLRVGQPMVLAREYSDLLVVGIVVLFLAAVVVLEAVEYCGDLRSAFCGRSGRRGEIFLEDDERVGKRQFCSMPATALKWKSPLTPVREGISDDEKGELYHD